MRDYNFGNFLHELRTKKSLTQQQIGALVGVSDKAVSKWENGSSKPRSDILYKLCDILEISVDELLSGELRSSSGSAVRGIFESGNMLWNKAFGLMRERYEDIIPLEVMNRFLLEKTHMRDSDMIVYFDFLSMLVRSA